MSNLDEARKNAFIININNTEKYLNTLYQKTNYKIESESPINDINIKIEKGERCFKFVGDALIKPGSSTKYKGDYLGYTESFNLVSTNESICAYKGVGSISLSPMKYFSSTGEIWELKSTAFENISYYRCILTLSEGHEDVRKFINSKPFKTERVFSPIGYIKIRVGEFNVGIYNTDINKKESLIIECYNFIELKQFESIVSSIISCFGMISGSLVRDEMIILQYQSENLDEVNGFSYKKIKDSYIGISAINPRILHESTKRKFPFEFLGDHVFENLINNSLNDLRLMRAIRLIGESFKMPNEVKASNYSVVLETIKNIVIEENEEKVNPFKRRSDAKIVKNEFLDIIKNKNDEIFNNKDTVIKKIEHLNQVSNRDSFILVFKILKIKLNTDDINCIEMRNDFLHGRIPFENEEEKDAENKLLHIVYKLHLLITSLILKYCGYNGFVFNNIMYLNLLHFNKKLTEPLFRKI